MPSRSCLFCSLSLKFCTFSAQALPNGLWKTFTALYVTGSLKLKAKIFCRSAEKEELVICVELVQISITGFTALLQISALVMISKILIIS